MSEDLNVHSYSQLDPDTIINAIESLEYISDKRILALNSYENRVYQIGIEDAAPIIANRPYVIRPNNPMLSFLLLSSITQVTYSKASLSGSFGPTSIRRCVSPPSPVAGRHPAQGLA